MQLCVLQIVEVEGDVDGLVGRQAGPVGRTQNTNSGCGLCNYGVLCRGSTPQHQGKGLSLVVFPWALGRLLMLCLLGYRPE